GGAASSRRRSASSGGCSVADRSPSPFESSECQRDDEAEPRHRQPDAEEPVLVRESHAVLSREQAHGEQAVVREHLAVPVAESPGRIVVLVDDEDGGFDRVDVVLERVGTPGEEADGAWAEQVLLAAVPRLIRSAYLGVEDRVLVAVDGPHVRLRE